jgi:hypothetical protein
MEDRSQSPTSPDLTRIAAAHGGFAQLVAEIWHGVAQDLERRGNDRLQPLARRLQARLDTQQRHLVALASDEANCEPLLPKDVRVAMRNAAAEPWVEPIPPALVACILAGVDEVMRDIRVSDVAAEEGKAESERECWTPDELSLVLSLFSQRFDEAIRVL